MKQLIGFILIAFVSHSALAQGIDAPYQSVSLRLGVPLGITYKVYTGKKEAFELGLGSASPYWSNHYYINSFNSFSKYKDFKYLDHQVENTLYLQGRYLKDFAIPTAGMEGQLNWYCGAGALLKVARVKYTYTNIEANPPTQRDEHTDIDFGPEAIIGAEYWLEDTPFSFYGEASAMLEIFDRLGARTFGAVGIRYHFFQ
jgi:hypothetical protein